MSPQQPSSIKWSALDAMMLSQSGLENNGIDIGGEGGGVFGEGEMNTGIATGYSNNGSGNGDMYSLSESSEDSIQTLFNSSFDMWGMMDGGG